MAAKKEDSNGNLDQPPERDDTATPRNDTSRQHIERAFLSATNTTEAQPEKGDTPRPSLSASDTETSQFEQDVEGGRRSRQSNHGPLTQNSRSMSLCRTVSEVRDGIENRREVDLEEPFPDNGEKQRQELQPTDPNLVAWNQPHDPGNPKQWSIRRKWAALVCVSCYTFLSPVSSSMIAPALKDVARDLNIPDPSEQALTLSIFVLAYALGPLFWGPLSELYGRVIILQCTNLLYMFFNLGCGLAQTKGQMIAFRFIAGLGGSAPMAIGGGVLGDVFLAEQRGKAMSIYSLVPLLGPAVGPLAGGFITEGTTWRWIFYSTTILTVVIQAVGFFVLQETYAPVLLARRKRQRIKETGNTNLRTEFDDPSRTFTQTLRTAMTRPFRMLATQIIIQILALYMMFLYGIVYLMFTTFPYLWEGIYGQSVGIAGLNYISIGLGCCLGAQICAPLQDRIYAALKRRYVPDGGPGRPEFRVPMMIPGAFLVPAGLLVYGWTAQARTHWIGPNVGAAMFSAGTVIGFQCIQGFLVDTYTRYAASAVGAATVLRSLAGFGFPLFAQALYDKLDFGWGNTLLALLAIVIGWPGPLLLWKFGPKLREKSTFAAGGGS